jgi:hypothetical protein
MPNDNATPSAAMGAHRPEASSVGLADGLAGAAPRAPAGPGRG